MNTLDILLEGRLKPHHIPFLLAVEKGIYAENDLEIRWKTPTDTSGDIDPLYDNEVDFIITRPLNLVSEFLDGNEIVGLSRFFHTDSGVLYSTESDLTNPGDLTAEYNIVCNGINKTLAFHLLNSLVSADTEGEKNLDESEMNIEVCSEDPIDSILDGDAELMITAGVNPEGLQMDQGGCPVDFWFYQDYDLPSNGDLIIATSRERVDAAPNDVKDFIHSTHEAAEFIESNSDEARSILRDEYPAVMDEVGAKALLHTSLSVLKTDFAQDFQSYTQWGEYLTEELGIDRFLDVDRVIDERFIPMESITF